MAIAILLGCCADAAAVQLEPVVSGLSSPVYLTHARDNTNRLFILEQPGRVLVLQPGSSIPTVFLDITANTLSGGEQGLLGLAFHPSYATNRRFFVNYTRQPDGATVIAEYQASSSDPNLANPAETVILVILQPFANHNGGMIEFGPDGFLYIGMGDGGSGNDPDNRAQNINELLGKMLRIDVDTSTPYTSPTDNPFLGPAPGSDEIFAQGFRNPFRWSFDRNTGTLYAGDVGQGAQEEIDIVTRGGNFGWRIFEGSLCTNLDPALCIASNFVFPIAEYAQSEGRCSVIGGYVYRGSRGVFTEGAYVFGDFCTGEIFQLFPADASGTVTRLLDTSLSLSSFGEDEGGEIYAVDLVGTVFRLIPGEAPSGGDSDGNCFIATAAFGSPLAAELHTLRAFRDRYLMPSSVGRVALMIYHQISPPFANIIARHEFMRAATRLLLWPIVWWAQLALESQIPASMVLLLAVAMSVGIVGFLIMRGRGRSDLNANR